MSKPIIHIEQCGFLTTIQDLGRQGFLQYGVSRGGAMDMRSAALANILVGNKATEAVVEMTQSPHRFHFLEDCIAAFTGGGLQPMCGEEIISLHQPVFMAKGKKVEIKKPILGFRLYAAVAGGFHSDVFLNSRATDLLVKEGGYKRPLRKEDVLENNALREEQKIMLARMKSGFQSEEISFSFHTKCIRIIEGAERHYLTEESKKNLLQHSFKISMQSNRMGYRLPSALTTNRSCDITSSAVTQGTIQLTSSGEMIILMADAQTVGGYPRIAQVCAADLPTLAQKKPGDEILFKLISLQEAENLYLNEQRQMNVAAEKVKQVYVN